MFPVVFLSLLLVVCFVKSPDFTTFSCNFCSRFVFWLGVLVRSPASNFSAIKEEYSSNNRQKEGKRFGARNSNAKQNEGVFDDVDVLIHYKFGVNFIRDGFTLKYAKKFSCLQ